jgi:acetolactate synthase-1/3 small subunit
MSRRAVQTLILLVDNEFGVLTRVTALVRREGWNIKSLAVAETMDPAVSRLTISVECIDSTLPHVLERLGRLACVKGITAYAEATHFSRELILVTLEGGEGERAIKEAEGLGARILDSSGGMLTVEFSGEPGHAEALIATLKSFGTVNIARSGIVALERPAKEAGEHAEG